MGGGPGGDAGPVNSLKRSLIVGLMCFMAGVVSGIADGQKEPFELVSIKTSRFLV